MDKIHIRDLSLRTIIGTFPEERENRQDILLNIELRCDLAKAGKSDNLADTIDYKSVKKAIIAMVEASSFYLIEALVAKVADICLSYQGVESVKVTLDKPGALRFARSVAVEIERP
jgi:FolB domain-containing protein